MTAFIKSLAVLKAAACVLLACSVLTLPACVSSQAQPEPETAGDTISTETVLELGERWREAYSRGDADSALSLFTEDALYAPGSGELFRGRAEIQDALSEELTVPRDLRTDEVLASRLAEDMGYLVSRYTLRIVHSDRILVPDTTTEVVTGQAMAVFRRQPDGAWAIEALLFTPDPSSR